MTPTRTCLDNHTVYYHRSKYYKKAAILITNDNLNRIFMMMRKTSVEFVSTEILYHPVKLPDESTWMRTNFKANFLRFEAKRTQQKSATWGENNETQQ